MPNVLTMISDKDRLDFSQNYSIQRNYVGDVLFPDVKTDNLEAEYERLAEGMELPTAAMVHAFDTEAAIGVRPSIEKLSTEKLLIKEKINPETPPIIKGFFTIPNKADFILLFSDSLNT